jgi:hypothetical protein
VKAKQIMNLPRMQADLTEYKKSQVLYVIFCKSKAMSLAIPSGISGEK